MVPASLSRAWGGGGGRCSWEEGRLPSLSACLVSAFSAITNVFLLQMTRLVLPGMLER